MTCPDGKVRGGTVALASIHEPRTGKLVEERVYPPEKTRRGRRVAMSS
ncbi:MAG: hypothetical protein WKG01_19210 [Kofleriaceae bacterium]